jgi:hypothetical protein
MVDKELEPVEGLELALNSQDSHPPLVVDLPDGQKLVVGDLDPGKVIEIATWRGTGRPDSRTNRLMLGVSTNEDEAISKKQNLTKKIENVELSSNNQLLSEDLNSPKQLTNENLSSKKVVTGVIYSNVLPEGRSNFVAKDPTKKEATSNIKTSMKWIGGITAVGVVVISLLITAGLNFIHPKAGAGTALGGAKSSIAVVQADKNLSVGESVVADIPGDGLSPIVAIIAAVSDRELLLSTESGYIQIKKDQLHGKVVAILPFIGEIANLISR